MAFLLPRLLQLLSDESSQTVTGWLNSFNAELSSERYWRGPRSQKMREEEEYTLHYTVTTRMTLALKWAATRAILMFH